MHRFSVPLQTTDLKVFRTDPDRTQPCTYSELQEVGPNGLFAGLDGSHTACENAQWMTQGDLRDMMEGNVITSSAKHHVLGCPMSFSDEKNSDLTTVCSAACADEGGVSGEFPLMHIEDAASPESGPQGVQLPNHPTPDHVVHSPPQHLKPTGENVTQQVANFETRTCHLL